MSYFLPDKAYNVLKWVGLIAIPAVATFVGTVGTALGWVDTETAVTCITACGTLIGALLGISSATAKEDTESAEDSGESRDATIATEEAEAMGAGDDE